VSRWLERTFDLGLPLGAAPAVFERLRSTAARLEAAVRDVPVPLLIHRPGGKWSIQEHIGHLGDLEALGLQRLDDFDAGSAVLTGADRENRQTDEAGHNSRTAAELVARFRAERERFLSRVEAMDRAALSRRAVHPRLGQSMSVVDLCFFIAEHDDHHVASAVGIFAALAEAPLCALDLLNTLDAVMPRLTALDEARTAGRPGAGKWSPREIIGHLIDSASNNHGRFVRGQTQDDLVFEGYDQEQWVEAQRYQDVAWPDLVALWSAYNRHLAHVMRSAPATVRARPHTRHSLDRTAFVAVPPGQPATLEYVMEDYVRHLRHHLRQIPGVLEP
jgi:hypothetical protein